MRIRVARIEIVAALAAALAIFTSKLCAAEDGVGSATTNAAPVAAAGGGSSTDAAAATATQNPENGANTTATGLDYLYNKKPVDGSVMGGAQDANSEMVERARAADALNLGKLADPQLRAQFDKYLTTSEVPTNTLAAYAAQMQQVRGLLDANRTFDAWKGLLVLAQYEDIDAGVSGELANRIESIWNNGRASNQMAQVNAQLSQNVREANRNADVLSDRIREEELEFQRQANSGGRVNSRGRNGGGSVPGGNGGVPMLNGTGGTEGNGVGMPQTVSVTGLEGRLELTQEYLDGLQARARIKLNELKTQKLLDKAEADFAAYIKTLYSTGRYQQVVLAAEFYLKIFDEGEYPVEIANEVNASLETARDVKNSVDVFRYDVSKNQIAAATERLQEAFSTSDLNPAVLGLERPLEERAEEYLKQLDKMENLIEARDFGSLQPVIEQTQGMAADFDNTKPMALVNAVKLESKLDLGKAKLAAQAGDLKDAMEEFESAAKAWPGNPDLQDSSNTFFQTEDTKNQSVAEFDRLINEQNYRGIFEKQLAFAPAIHGDSKREAQLADALQKIKNAEIAAEKADQMRNAGDVCGAWEAVELASKDLPGDNKLNSLRADLAGKATTFVGALNNAEDAETRVDLGYSLSWYAAAQHYYPASLIANDGIERISKAILNPKGS